MNKEAALRKHLVGLLGGKGAHVAFEEAVGDFPAHLPDWSVGYPGIQPEQEPCITRIP
jgi:hypothetical protein